LHADLRGYRALVERLPPADAAGLLGQFFAVLTGAVLECGGQVFQLAEAELVAGFGVGDARHSQILEALTAARVLQRRFLPIRQSWQRLHHVDAGVGIGLDRGPVAIGVFGPFEHPSRTLVGPPVSVAAELSRHARAGEVLLSGAVHLPGAPVVRCLHRAPLHLSGRRSPIEVWRLQASARAGAHAH
jgi:adenylate cyclase